MDDLFDSAVDLSEAIVQWLKHPLGRTDGREAGNAHPSVEFGEEHGDLATVWFDQVAMGAGNAPKDPLQPKPAQLIGHLPSCVGREIKTQIRGDFLPERAMVEPVRDA